MKKHILCFGDSNTHGYCIPPEACQDGLGRFNENERWTKLLQTSLGDDYLVIEEGLCGRTTVFDDPLVEGLKGLDYLMPCLRTHQPIDLLVFMLGTNDTKDRFAVSAGCIGIGMRRLVEYAKFADCWGNHAPNILIISPPPIQNGMHTSSVAPTMGTDCAEKSRQLAEIYEALAKEVDCHFLNADGCEFNQVDFMHLTAQGHQQLSNRLTQLIPSLV